MQENCLCTCTAVPDKNLSLSVCTICWLMLVCTVHKFGATCTLFFFLTRHHWSIVFFFFTESHHPWPTLSHHWLPPTPILLLCHHKAITTILIFPHSPVSTLTFLHRCHRRHHLLRTNGWSVSSTIALPSPPHTYRPNPPRDYLSTDRATWGRWRHVTAVPPGSPITPQPEQSILSPLHVVFLPGDPNQPKSSSSNCATFITDHFKPPLQHRTCSICGSNYLDRSGLGSAQGGAAVGEGKDCANG